MARTSLRSSLPSKPSLPMVTRSSGSPDTTKSEHTSACHNVSQETPRTPSLIQSRNHVVDFEFRRTFKYPPVLPSLPILSSFFAGQKNWYRCHAQLHLKPLSVQEGKGGEDKGGKRMFVNKVSTSEPPQPPIVNYVYVSSCLSW